MLEVRLFGPPEVRAGGVPVPLASGRARKLLAYLALRAGTAQRREHLADLLWPASPAAQGRTNLRHVVHTLRTTVPGADGLLRSTRDTLGWAGGWTDVAAFDAALDAAGTATGPEQLDRLRAAVDLYAGDLLPGWDDEWVLAERERTRRRALAAYERLAGLLADRGELDAAIAAADRARALDPLAEGPCRALMRLYDARGDRARALRVYHECAATLREELGTDPSEATRADYEALLPAERGPAADRLAGPPALVGRQAERRRLVEVWTAARRGRAQLVVITGEPGIGKTRLVDELRLSAAARGVVTAAARSYPVEGAPAYGPVVEWLREPAVARWRDRLDPGALAALARLLPDLPGADHTAPEPPDGTGDGADPRIRLFAAAARALLAGGGPILLVADDLHAADRQTVQFLHYLVRTRPEAPLLVAATARLAETDDADPLRELLRGLGALDRVTRLELGRLAPAETAALAAQHAGQPLPPGTLERLHAETEGNPLFVVEMLRAGGPGSVLAPKVQAVLESRLARLTPGARDLLGLAATVGSSIPVDVLTRLRPDDEDGLTRDLDELWRRQLLLPVGADTYDFSHDKLREVAYGSLPPARRRHNHRTLARTLAELPGGHPDTVAGRVAAHLDAAGAAAEAADWYVRAATAAQRVHADADAAHLLDRALAAVQSTADSPARRERELELLTALAGPLAAAEGYDSARLAAALADALDLGGGLGRPPAAPLVRALGMAALSRGDTDAALDLGGRLRAGGETDDVLAVEGAFVQGMAAYWQGDLDRARSHLEFAVARYRPANRPAHLRSFGQDPKALCLARLAHVHLFGGDAAAARALRDASLDHAREAGHPFTLATTLAFAGLLDVELADVPALRGRVAELAGLRGRVEAPPILLIAEALTGHLDVLDGRRGPGLARIDATLADPARRTAPGLPAILLRLRLAACQGCGDAAGSADAARRLLAGDVRVWDGLAHAVLAGPAAAPRPAAAAER